MYMRQSRKTAVVILLCSSKLKLWSDRGMAEDASSLPTTGKPAPMLLLGSWFSLFLVVMTVVVVHGVMMK